MSRKNPLLEMNAFWQTSSCVDTGGRKTTACFLAQRAILSRLSSIETRSFMTLWVWKVLPSRIFDFNYRVSTKNAILQGGGALELQTERWKGKVPEKFWK